MKAQSNSKDRMPHVSLKSTKREFVTNQSSSYKLSASITISLLQRLSVKLLLLV